MCDLPPITGDVSTCLDQITRFYYNSRTGQCEYFVYGGCGATDNNFESKEKCERNINGLKN